MRHLLLLLLATLAVATDAVPTARQRSSWIAIDESICERTLVEGQRYEVAVDYVLSEGPAAKLVLSAHGPWIDLPDGKYETRRHHVDYPGLYADTEIQPGRGRHVFSFTIPKLHGHDSLLWIARFAEGGKAWPWERRLHGGTMARAEPVLGLSPAAPGGLFTYTEPVRFQLSFGPVAKPAAQVVATWQITGRDGVAVAEGKTSVAVPAAGATATLEIPCQRRGVFGLGVSVEGVGAAEGSFARIPDVMAATKGEPTRFGFHDIAIVESDAAMDAQFAMARRLGLTFCRFNLSWKHIEPARGEWRLDGLDRAIAKAVKHGIAPMLNIHDPPAWAATRRSAAGFEPFAFDEAGWSEAITHLSRRYKGRIAAWEWLNEIVPGPEEDPVGIYLNMVRLGNAAAKAEDPTVLSVLAGGLWPRSFRLGLLAAGVGAHIDALPIHYGDAAGIAEAAGDLAAASASRVQVWDDETSAGTSTWRMPLGEAMAQVDQRAWAMNRFPGQLTAGAQRIVWFGQGRDPAGNWDYAWSYDSPRPIAATLALLAAKLHRAEPQGGFAIGDSGRFDLFAVGGKAVLVAPAAKAGLRLRVGSADVTISDDQGEEARIATQGGDAALPASPLPVFVEGGDLEVLRGYTVPELLTPQLSLLAGRQEPLRIRLSNRSAKPLDCTLAVGLPEGWPKSAPLTFRLPAANTRLVEIPIIVPAKTPGADHRLQLECTYADARMPRVSLPWQLAVIDPKRLGNLLDDGGFEKGGAAWGSNETCRVEAVDGFNEGLGSNALHMSGPVGWKSVSQAQVLPAGRSYLYSAWLRVTDKRQAGSNIKQQMNDGSAQTLYIPQVFSAANVPEWQFLTTVYEAPKDLMMVNFSPVAQGEAYYDNVRLSTYEGSNFAAEAVRAVTAPVIDGDLSDWAAGCPIPLLGPGQTTIFDKSWTSGAANLRGVAKLTWDEKNLYLAAWIEDDVLAAPQTGDRTTDSDSLVLAIHPANRAPGTDEKAYCYYLSPASPGGGSGTSTLFRPAAHSGGLPSGQLAKDSSVYELAIRRDGTRTRYEVRLPWTQLGAAGRLGAKFGLSLQLNDNDGKGRAAIISWGDGLHPAWAPASFGVLTLVE